MSEKDVSASDIESLDERLALIEDNAWSANSCSTALEFIVGNLLIELDKRGLINGSSFIDQLSSAVDKLEAPGQISAKAMLQQLRLHVGEKGPGGFVPH